MPSYKILFNSRRIYFFEAHRTVIEKLIELGHSPVVAPMQFEQDELFRRHFMQNNYDIELMDAEEAAHEEWDLIVLSGRLYERQYLHPPKLVFFGHGGTGGGNSPEPYNLAAFALENMDAYLACSNGEIDHGEKINPGVWENKIVKTVGWPKLDRAINHREEIRKEMQQTLSLDPDKPTVVMTSHWHEASLLRTVGFGVLNELSSSSIIRESYNVIVTVHPLLLSDSRKAFGGRPEKLLRAFCTAPHMYFYPADDSTSILASGDVFICDYSSIACEAAALGNPVIFYLSPDYSYSDKKLLKHTLEATFPLSIPAALPELIEKALNLDEKQKFQIKKLADYNYVNQGSATEAAALALVDIALRLNESD